MRALEGALAQAQGRADAGKAAEGAGDLTTAAAYYREAIKICKSPEWDRRLAEVQQKLQARQQEEDRRRATAQRLYEEGQACEKRGDLPCAIDRYEEAVRTLPNDKLAAHVRELRDRMEQAAKGNGSKPTQPPQQPNAKQAPPPANPNGSVTIYGTWVSTQGGQTYTIWVTPAGASASVTVESRGKEGVVLSEGHDLRRDGASIDCMLVIRSDSRGVYKPGQNYLRVRLTPISQTEMEETATQPGSRPLRLRRVT